MKRVFMKGCEAIAEAAIRSGCRFFAGYPITPQNEIPEYLARRMPEVTAGPVPHAVHRNGMSTVSTIRFKAPARNSLAQITEWRENLVCISSSSIPKRAERLPSAIVVSAR